MEDSASQYGIRDAVFQQVSQEDRRGRPGEEEAVGALLEELRGASSELGRARAALEDAVQQSASSAPESDVPTGRGFYTEACREDLL